MLRIQRFREEVEAAIARVIGGTSAIRGPEVAGFELALAAYCTTSHAVGVGSGTDALLLALRAAGIGPGDEVITVALTAAGTAQSILLSGATPVYVDIDPVTRCIDPKAIRAAIGSKTAAIVPVHLFGHMADMHEIARLAAQHGLFLLEDCAQALGANIDGRKAGTFGHAAAFSFYPTKNLGCVGDGGAIVTSDASLAEKIRMLSNYGWTDSHRISNAIAGNSRLDELQAAILSALLPHLDVGNQERRNIARRYLKALQGFVDVPYDQPGTIWHQFVIESYDRDGLAERLQSDGIGTGVHYHPPLHHQPALVNAFSAPLPVTERLSKRFLSLPIQPEAVGTNIDRIIDTIKRRVNS
jgi:dTDP-3-amino-3,4,6-trideoxy-alpha-D-glucose transaminase